MELETVLYAVEDGIATLTLNRPDALNALDPHLIADLRAGLEAATLDQTVRTILFTGAGRGFCAGADLANPGQAPEGHSPGQAVAHSLEHALNPLIRAVMDAGKPTVTAVNGPVAGGGVGLALAADIVIAAQSAYFAKVFVPRLGLIPDLGCTWFIPRLIGHARARALAMLGDRLDADTAADWGLIWKAVPDDALMAEARTVATRLGQAAPSAVVQARHALDQSWLNTLDDQLALERHVQGMLGDTQDFREGVRAFLERRDPRFTGQ